MHLLTRITFFSACLLVTHSSLAQAVAGPGSCSGEVTEAIAAALRVGLADAGIDRSEERIDLNAPTIVEAHFAVREQHLYVLDFVSEMNCRVALGVLPQPRDIRFSLISDSELGELAAEIDESGLPYVRIQSVRFEQGTVGVRVGVAIQPSPRETQPLLCCCGGEMLLSRVPGEWQFQRWQNVYCV